MRSTRLSRLAAVGLMALGVPLIIFLVWAPNDPPLKLRASEVRVTSLRQESGGWVAEADGPEGHRLELRAGTRLSGGVVRSVSALGVFVEVELVMGLYKPAEKHSLRFSPSRALSPITLGHDTTRITSPLLADGTPDYGAWMNEEYGAGITPEDNAAPEPRRSPRRLRPSGRRDRGGACGSTPASRRRCACEETG